MRWSKMELNFCNPSPTENAQAADWVKGREYEKGHWTAFLFPMSLLFQNLTDGETEAQMEEGAVPNVIQVVLS